MGCPYAVKASRGAVNRYCAFKAIVGHRASIQKCTSEKRKVPLPPIGEMYPMKTPYDIQVQSRNVGLSQMYVDFMSPVRPGN